MRDGITVIHWCVGDKQKIGPNSRNIVANKAFHS